MIYLLNDPSYLHASQKVDKKILDAEKYERYFDIVMDQSAPDELKRVILKFFIPYKISLLKVKLNRDFLSNPYAYLYEDTEIVAPSLVMLKKETLVLPPGYPDWFYAGFPDVAWWMIEGSGTKLIYEKEGIPPSELMDGNHLKDNVIKEFIDKYLSETGNKLECSIYKP